jgi:hypothetical protein
MLSNFLLFKQQQPPLVVADEKFRETNMQSGRSRNEETSHGTVYFLAHFCPVAFFRQMITLKITLKKTHF